MYHIYSIFIISTLCIRKRETILCLQYIYHLEREKLCHTYSMFIIYILCIRKRETVSYLQYLYDIYISGPQTPRHKLCLHFILYLAMPLFSLVHHLSAPNIIQQKKIRTTIFRLASEKWRKVYPNWPH